MSSTNSSMVNSACLEEIGPNTYRCKNHKYIISTTQLPIRCGFCDKDEVPQFPSIAKQIANFTKASVKHIANGAKNVDETELKRRIGICNSNICGKYQDGRCAACGCFLSIKTLWESEHCPDGLW